MGSRVCAVKPLICGPRKLGAGRQALVSKMIYRCQEIEAAASLYQGDSHTPQLLSTAADMHHVSEGQKCCMCGQLLGLPMRQKQKCCVFLYFLSCPKSFPNAKKHALKLKPIVSSELDVRSKPMTIILIPILPIRKIRYREVKYFLMVTQPVSSAARLQHPSILLPRDGEQCGTVGMTWVTSPRALSFEGSSGTHIHL